MPTFNGIQHGDSFVTGGARLSGVDDILRMLWEAFDESGLHGALL